MSNTQTAKNQSIAKSHQADPERAASKDVAIVLDPNRLWTFREARYYPRIADSTLRSYVRSGRVKAYRMGGKEGHLILFKKEDLDTIIFPIEPADLSSGEEREGSEEEE